MPERIGARLREGFPSIAERATSRWSESELEFLAKKIRRRRETRVVEGDATPGTDVQNETTHSPNANQSQSLKRIHRSAIHEEFREWIRRDEAGRSTADKTQLEIPEVSVDTILKVRAFVKNWRAKGLIANKGNDETDESSTSSLQLVRKIQTPLTQVFVSRDPKACARAARDAMTMENVVSSHATLTDDCNSTHRSRYSGYATRCRHLTLDDNDDSNGFFHPTTQKWHATFSVRTVRVGSFDTPTHVKFVVCEQCHDAVQRRKLCSVVFCVGCCLNVPVSATEENDSGRLCVCCAALVRKKKKRDTTARRLECTPGNIEYDRAIAEYNTQSTKSSVGFMDAADVPNLDTILFKSTGANGNVFKWDPLRREAHSSENEVRWRVGGHTAQNVQRELTRGRKLTCGGMGDPSEHKNWGFLNAGVEPFSADSFPARYAKEYE